MSSRVSHWHRLLESAAERRPARRPRTIASRHPSKILSARASNPYIVGEGAGTMGGGGGNPRIREEGSRPGTGV